LVPNILLVQNSETYAMIDNEKRHEPVLYHGVKVEDQRIRKN
jgi:hypothetical protein